MAPPRATRTLALALALACVRTATAATAANDSAPTVAADTYTTTRAAAAANATATRALQCLVPTVYIIGGTAYVAARHPPVEGSNTARGYSAASAPAAALCSSTGAPITFAGGSNASAGPSRGASSAPDGMVPMAQARLYQEPLAAIPGDLIVRSADPHTGALRGLRNITAINGSLRVEFTRLATMAGLGNVEFIGGSLNIEHNEELKSLQGLDGLRAIGGNLRIGWNGCRAGELLGGKQGCRPHIVLCHPSSPCQMGCTNTNVACPARSANRFGAN